MATLPSAGTTPLQPARRARITHKLNLRRGPSVAYERIGRLEPGQTLLVDRVIDGEPYLGRGTWFGVADRDHCFWSGGAQLDEDDVAAPPPPTGFAPPDVKRRANQTIAPLSALELAQVYGVFDTTPGRQRGAVVIPAAWVSANLEEFSHDVLKAIGVRSTTLHKRAAPYFKAVFDEIARQDLDGLIQTFDGGWVPRHISWNPAKPLSSHTWGVAIDINARWNGLNQQPALPGQPGHLAPLVPIFAASGFAWGGHFGSPLDGMHFELARRNP